MKLPACRALLLAALMLGAGCATPALRAPDAELVRHTRTAQAAYERGALEQAIEAYRAALARARRMDDQLNAARAAYNLAVCLAAAGRYPEADELLVQARASLGTRGHEAAAVRLAQARIARAESRPETASLAKESLEAGADGATALQALSLLAEVALNAGDLSGAEQTLRRAEKCARRVEDPAARAELEGVTARLALLRQRPAEAAVRLDARAQWLNQARQYAALAATLQAAGDAHRDAGARREAFDRYWRAAQSFLGGGQAAEARAAAQAARTVAQQLGNQQLEELLTAFEGELDRATGSGAR